MQPQRQVHSDQEYTAELRQNLSRCFDEEELRTLCSDLGVDYDSLRGEGKEAKVRELIAYHVRHDRILQLVATLKEQRPDVPWQELLGPLPPAPRPVRPTPSERGRNRMVKIAVALIGAIATIIVGYWQFVPKPIREPRPQELSCRGRVIDAATGDSIYQAKVTLEIPGSLPVIGYTDTDGVYSLSAESYSTSVGGRVRVEATGYERFERIVTVSCTPRFEEILLTPYVTVATSTPMASPMPTQKPTYIPVPPPMPTPKSTDMPVSSPMPTQKPTDTLPPITATVCTPPPSLECKTLGGIIEPCLCVAGVSVQINGGTPRPVVFNEAVTLTAGDTLGLMNLRYCTSSKDLADSVAGEAYFFPNDVETYTYGRFTSSGPHILADCGDVGDFVGSWTMEPGQHRVVITLMHYFSEEKRSYAEQFKGYFTGKCKEKGECEVDDRFYINLNVEP